MDASSSASRRHVVRASEQGTSHSRTGQPCQDSSRVGGDAPGGIFVAAIADGAGSAEISADGSRIAARAATKTTSRLLDLDVHPLNAGALKEILEESILSAKKELKAEAQRQKRPLKQFATTLIVPLRAPEITGAAQVGDGAMVTAGDGISADEDGDYTLFSAPQCGEYANTTNFITSSGWRATHAIGMLRESVSRVAMFTDGVQSIALNATSGNTPHVPFFDPLFSWADKQEDASAAGDNIGAFLSTPRVTVRAGDDLTLLLGVRR